MGHQRQGKESGRPPHSHPSATAVVLTTLSLVLSTSGGSTVLTAAGALPLSCPPT